MELEQHPLGWHPSAFTVKIELFPHFCLQSDFKSALTVVRSSGLVVGLTRNPSGKAENRFIRKLVRKYPSMGTAWRSVSDSQQLRPQRCDKHFVPGRLGGHSSDPKLNDWT
jgi:hypothetical protein